MMTRAPVAVACALLIASSLAAAQGSRDVRIDISKAGGRIRLHCEPLTAPAVSAAEPTPATAAEVLANDLDHSAVFAVSRAWAGQDPGDAQAVVSGQWVVSGRTVRLSGEVHDLPARRSIMVREYRGTIDNWRLLVHRFADDVVLQFTGDPGVASSRLAFVASDGRNKELYVMDFDGAGLQALTADHSIALSPSWSYDGSLILFTSYRGGGGPRIYVVHSSGGKAYLISGRSGLNTSATYSPDGREIACTLSQDGNSEIYLLDARGESPRRLTNNSAIDTSPAWSPTGREIAFTSDRDGTPQVYVMDREGGNVRRLTYDLSYTDSPAWSPKGDRIAFVNRSGGGFDIYVCLADGRGLKAVVTGASNENPRWSPDGRHLVFASNRDGETALYVSDLDDAPPRRLDTGGLHAMSPAWSPFMPAPNSP
jgi:TolB protein